MLLAFRVGVVNQSLWYHMSNCFKKVMECKKVLLLKEALKRSRYSFLFSSDCRNCVAKECLVVLIPHLAGYECLGYFALHDNTSEKVKFNALPLTMFVVLQNYRARYESEGCRGPIHGSKENTFPTIQVRLRRPYFSCFYDVL